MKILVTGAAGFLGRRLIDTLLSGKPFDSVELHVAQDRPGQPEPSTIVAVDTASCAIDDPRIDWRTGTIADADFVTSIVDRDVDVIYHLAAVVSGQAEAEFDLGMQINVDATRSLLEACRRLANAPRFVFASTVAVFGAPLPDVVPEDMAVRPQSSYGAEKAIAELLVTEYARKRFIDAVVCRLPTVAIRTGKPNAAASSFVSGIIREPLAGLDSVCPVPLDTRLWISSPATATNNLAHAACLPTSAFEGRATVNLPGLCVTPSEMLASLERLAGATVRARVHCETDARLMRIVCTWPGAFDVSRPLRLGFSADPDIDAVVRQFMDERRGL